MQSQVFCYSNRKWAVMVALDSFAFLFLCWGLNPGLSACEASTVPSSYILSHPLIVQHGVWTWGLSLLGRCSTTWATLPAHFCFGYFSGRVSLLTWAGLRPQSSHLYLLCSWDCRHAWPHIASASPWHFETGPYYTSPGRPWTHNPPVSTSWVLELQVGATMPGKVLPFHLHTSSVIDLSTNAVVSQCLEFDRTLTFTCEFCTFSCNWHPPPLAWRTVSISYKASLVVINSQHLFFLESL
jgi:hypothetical protein